MHVYLSVFFYRTGKRKELSRYSYQREEYYRSILGGWSPIPGPEEWLNRSQLAGNRLLILPRLLTISSNFTVVIRKTMMQTRIYYWNHRSIVVVQINRPSPGRMVSIKGVEISEGRPTL